MTLDDDKMVFPHRPEFAYRPRIFWGTTAACAVLAMMAPGVPWPMRIAAPGLALLVAALGFVVGWAPLKLQAMIWSEYFPRLIGMMCLAVFYFFSVGILINLLVFPFMATELRSEGITWGQFVLVLPAGVGAAAGAYRVFADHIVVV